MNVRPLLSVAAALLLFPFLSGCEIDSAENATRNVNINVAGYYTGDLEGRIVENNTGASITSFNIIQNGDQLQAIDNNGLIFRGSIGQVTDGSASFSLRGSTTAGQEATLAGSINVEGSTATMQGTWAEPSLFARVLASGDITGGQPIIDDGGTTSITLTTSRASIDVSSADRSATLTINGGSAPFTLSVVPGTRGSLPSSTSSRTATYTATSNNTGTATIRVSDSQGQSDTVTITQN